MIFIILLTIILINVILAAVVIRLVGEVNKLFNELNFNSMIIEQLIETMEDGFNSISNRSFSKPRRR